MIKKIVFLAVAVVAGLLLVSWAGLGSYTSTAWSNIRSNFKKQVPLEFEIQRVRNEVAQLVPDMQKNFKAVAEEMVAVGNLKEEIAATRTKLEGHRAEIKKMTSDLESGTPIMYDGRTYSRDRVRRKLERDFASFKICEAELKSKQQLLEARERTLDAAKEQLASLKSQKEQLEVQIAQLEAELKTVRLAQTRSQFHLDDGRLAQCKATLAEIRNRLQVEEKATALEGEFASDPIPVAKEAKPLSELTKEINSYIGDDAKADKVANGQR